MSNRIEVRYKEISLMSDGPNSVEYSVLTGFVGISRCQFSVFISSYQSSTLFEGVGQ